MKLAVIAANGRSGKIFVERALAAGHSVRAGVHHANNLIPHKRLTVVHCNATSEADLVNLISGQDAVVSFIGHVKGSPPQVQTDCMRALVSAMKAQGLTRVVSLTGTGVRFPDDRITVVDRVLNLSIRLIDPARIRDGVSHVEVLKQSGLDWTILRVLKLQNTRPRAFSLREHGPTKWYVSREEVAEATLVTLE
jgi:putative NADH-flavin reductase